MDNLLLADHLAMFEVVAELKGKEDTDLLKFFDEGKKCARILYAIAA